MVAHFEKPHIIKASLTVVRSFVGLQIKLDKNNMISLRQNIHSTNIELKSQDIARLLSNSVYHENIIQQNLEHVNKTLNLSVINYV